MDLFEVKLKKGDLVICISDFVIGPRKGDLGFVCSKHSVNPEIKVYWQRIKKKYIVPRYTLKSLTKNKTKKEKSSDEER